MMIRLAQESKKKPMLQLKRGKKKNIRELYTYIYWCVYLEYFSLMHSILLFAFDKQKKRKKIICSVSSIQILLTVKQIVYLFGLFVYFLFWESIFYSLLVNSQFFFFSSRPRFYYILGQPIVHHVRFSFCSFTDLSAHNESSCVSAT